MSSKTVSRAAVVALALGNTAVNAFWRLECPGSIGLARIDPLMDFDGLSGHVHALKGGSGKFGPSKHFPNLYHSSGPSRCEGALIVPFTVHTICETDSQTNTDLASSLLGQVHGR